MGRYCNVLLNDRYEFTHFAMNRREHDVPASAKGPSPSGGPQPSISLIDLKHTALSDETWVYMNPLLNKSGGDGPARDDPWKRGEDHRPELPRMLLDGASRGPQGRAQTFNRATSPRWKSFHNYHNDCVKPR